MKEVKGLSKEKNKTHRCRQEYSGYKGKGGWREVEESKGGKNGDGRTLDFRR